MIHTLSLDITVCSSSTNVSHPEGAQFSALHLMAPDSKNLWGLCHQFSMISLSTNSQGVKQIDLSASMTITAVSGRTKNEKQPLLL